jgi:D-methionine transport system substrate-binding protein
MKKSLSIILIGCLLVMLGVIAGCGDNTSEKGSDAPEAAKLVVGAIGEPHTSMLKMIKPDLAEQGIELEIMDFTEYPQLNPALHDGQIDANFFQHIPYLEDYIANTGNELVWTVKIHTEPMRIYSNSIDNVEDLPDGASVGIPNDPSNSGRALMILENAGLIKLKEDAGVTATENDIIENPKELKIQMADAAMLPRNLEDLDICCINTNYALDSGLDPVKDGIFVEPGDSPFANILVVRPEDKDDENIKKLGDALQSPEIAEYLQENYPSCVLAF